MKKSLRKLLLATMYLVIVNKTSTLNVVAKIINDSTKNKNDIWVEQINENGEYLVNIISGETMSGFISVSGESISINEMKERLNNYEVEFTKVIFIEEKLASCPIFNINSEARYNFNKRREWVSWKLNQFKVTPTIVGPATISYGNSITTTESFDFIPVTVTEPIRNLLRDNASFTWVNFASSITYFDKTFTVVDGKAGYVAFSPANNNISADVTINGVHRIVKGTSPIILSNNINDGFYACINCI